MNEFELAEAVASSGAVMPKCERHRKLGGILLSYAAAYIYIRYYLADFGWNHSWGLALFAMVAVALTELLLRDVPRRKESWFWLGCLVLVLGCLIFGRCLAWDGYEDLFLHGFFVWYVLCRADVLLAGESGPLLPLDALRGFVLLPFGNFYLRIRTAFSLFRAHRAERKETGEKAKLHTAAWSLLAVAVALGLLIAAAKLLMEADSSFGAHLQEFFLKIEDLLDLGKIMEWILSFLLSLPVGQYLYGLIAGAEQTGRTALPDKENRVYAALSRCRRVPHGVWMGVTAAFTALYLLFYLSQARYFFGAFSRTLPEDFVVSQYAREGFFELCKVMAVNFALLWLMTRTAVRPLCECRAGKALCLLLLGESLLFAVIAFSKLALYIDCFGFTPRRLQSTWLVCVLFLGCLAAGGKILSGRKTFKPWLWMSAASLALLCIY